jgi:hypothetical protein
MLIATKLLRRCHRLWLFVSPYKPVELFHSAGNALLPLSRAADGFRDDLFHY